jgi:hypothetical protein
MSLKYALISRILRHLSILIILGVLIFNLIIYYYIMSLKYALISRILRHLSILIILGVLIFNLIIYFMISQT